MSSTLQLSVFKNDVPSTLSLFNQSITTDLSQTYKINSVAVEMYQI